ncbi:MAG TPA: DNA gyrase inhibitor YacG [Caulobacteraceae bacterium]
MCGKPSHPQYRPFCSRRCADVDLQRWFTGRYAVPAVETDDDASETGRDGGE